MKINLGIFISSINEQKENNVGKLLMKSFESNIRPAKGDIIEDPGFHADYHNGYEVVKVTINYALNECFVSLHPLVLEREEMKTEAYIERLEAYGWCIVSKEELKNI